MNEAQIRSQSKAALKQWGEQWKAQAKEHSVYNMKSLEDFEFSGVGKAVLCVANGFTFEENIEVIKAHKDQIDIFACDKTMGHLLDNGIVPKFVMMCDANVDYEKYMAKWKDQLKDTILIANACGNPLWAKNGNWKDKYFFLNKDILESEKIFAEISGCPNFIPAGTNVSNAMVIMLTQSDNSGRRNFFGYDKILCIGYDYSWRNGKSYYSFDETGGGKHNYMRHIYMTTTDGDFCYTSGNLQFSAEWFETYVKSFNLPVVICSGKSILHKLKISSLPEQISYEYKSKDSGKIQRAVKRHRELLKQINSEELTIKTIQGDHWNSFVCSV